MRDDDSPWTTADTERLYDYVRFFRTRFIVYGIADEECLGYAWECLKRGESRGLSGGRLKWFVAWRLMDALKKNEGLTGSLKDHQQLAEGIGGTVYYPNTPATFWDDLWTWWDDSVGLRLPGLAELRGGLISVDDLRNPNESAKPFLQKIGGGDIEKGKRAIKTSLRKVRRIYNEHKRRGAEKDI